MHQLTRVESEKQVIADQCDRLMERLEARADGHGLTDTRSLREVVGLKKEVSVTHAVSGRWWASRRRLVTHAVSGRWWASRRRLV